MSTRVKKVDAVDVYQRPVVGSLKIPHWEFEIVGSPFRADCGRSCLEFHESSGKGFIYIPSHQPGGSEPVLEHRVRRLIDGAHAKSCEYPDPEEKPDRCE